MNHCMNWSEAKSYSSRAILVSSLICAVTRRSWFSASSTGATRSANSDLRRGDAGNRTGGVLVDQVLHHHHGVAPLLHRLGVEEPGHLRHGQRVVVHRARHVLLVGGELVADLHVELLDETLRRHG